MEDADDAFVPPDELQGKADGLVAQMLGVEAASMTSGAESAIVLSTAACMAGAEDRKIQQLPNVAGIRNEFLVQERQHYWNNR